VTAAASSKGGTRKAGYTVTTETIVLEANALPPGWSAPRAKHYTLIRALTLGQGKCINIYSTPSPQYIFTGVIYKERGLLTAVGKTIKNKEEILHLLKVIWLLKKVAVLHCRGQQKGNDPVTQGNQLADKIAKMTAIKKYKENLTLAAVVISEELHLDYTKREIE
jgi:hypothetical protein